MSGPLLLFCSFLMPGLFIFKMLHASFVKPFCFVLQLLLENFFGIGGISVDPF